MTVYYRPIPCLGPARPAGALGIAGGWTWASHAERLVRGSAREVIPIGDVPEEIRDALTRPRPAVARLDFGRPCLMGILNTTPDSFSDGGLYDAPEAALAHARQMLADGVDVLDIGGESTRPGAAEVDVDTEIARTAPVIAALRRETGAAISIDTRKAAVARAAGADLVNDVSALSFDPEMAGYLAGGNLPVCLMHAQGTPATMQVSPQYDDVLLEVYDRLSETMARAEAAGIARDRIIVDPGIGFGKTLEHNLLLLRGVSLFHALGCPILLGVSRKRFIGTLSGEEAAADRAPGSIGAALAALGQGVQILRVHDTLATRQAMTLWQASNGL